MSVAAPELLPLFRSATQAAVLTLLYEDPERAYTLAEIAGRIGSPAPTVQREATRLEAGGLLVSARIGRSRQVCANSASPIFPELQSLLRKVFGPATLLTRALRDVPGVDEAFVHGSWARRYAGVKGPPPEDIDLLVIGSPDLDALYRVVAAVEGELARPVDVTVLSPDEWETGDSAFLRQVRRQHLLPLALP